MPRPGPRRPLIAIRPDHDQLAQLKLRAQKETGGNLSELIRRILSSSLDERNTMTAWVYMQTESSLWTVGFYSPAGEWHTDSDHGDRDAAAQRVRWLNGGRDEQG